MLCRIPKLSFDELWLLFFSGNSEDRFGSLIILVSQHTNQMISRIASLDKEQIVNRRFRKRLLKMKSSLVLSDSFKGKQILSVIDKVLTY
jgi:hypothetical protein